MEEFEKIGRARVVDVRRDGGFVIKILEPEAPIIPIEPGSARADTTIEEFKETQGTNNSGGKKRRSNSSIRRGRLNDRVDNV